MSVCVYGSVESIDNLNTILSKLDILRGVCNVIGVFFEYDEDNRMIGDALIDYSLMWSDVHICFSDHRLHIRTNESCLRAIRNSCLEPDTVIMIDRLGGCRRAQLVEEENEVIRSDYNDF